MSSTEHLREIILNGADLVLGRSVSEDDSFEELGMDSLDVLNFIRTTEVVTNVEIPDESLENITTLKDLIRAVENPKN